MTPMTPSNHNGAPASNKSTNGYSYGVHETVAFKEGQQSQRDEFESRIKALEDWVEKVKDQLI